MPKREAEEHFDRAIHFFRGGFFPAALQEFRFVERIDPHYPNISYLISATLKKVEEVTGKILNEIEDSFDDEIKKLSESLHIDDATSDLAPQVEKFLRLGRYQEALEKLEQASTFVPDSRPLLLLKSNVFRRLGKTKDAEKLLRRAQTLYPDDPEILNNLGNVCLAENQYVEAREKFREAMKLAPDNLSIQNNLGALEMQTYNLDAAFRIFENILAVKSNWSYPRRNLENIKIRTRELDNEIETLKKEFGEHPTYFDIALNLGKSLMFRGYHQEARHTLERVIEKRPNLIAAYYYLGTLFELEGNLDKAISHFREMVVRKGKTETSEFKTFESLYREKYVEEAIHELKKLAVLDLDLSAGHINIGIRYFEEGNWKKAMEHFDKAVSIKDNYPDAFYWKALTKIRLGKKSDAVKDLQQALDLNPKYADAHYQLGMLLRKKFPKKAKDHLENAIKSGVRTQFAVIARDILSGDEFKNL